MMKIRRANTAAATARRAATPIGGTDRAMSKGAEPSSSSTGRRISSRSTTPRRTSTPTPAPRSGATTPKRNWTEFHQKSKQFVEEREQFLDKLREQQDKDALTECTFQPQLKSKPPVGGGDFKARANSLSSLYEKGREVQQKKAERMERIRQELIEKEMAECSFRPEIRPRVRRVETPPSPPPILRQSYSAATRRGNFSLVGGRGSDGSCLLAGASPHWGPSPHDAGVRLRQGRFGKNHLHLPQYQHSVLGKRRLHQPLCGTALHAVCLQMSRAHRITALCFRV